MQQPRDGAHAEDAFMLFDGDEFPEDEDWSKSACLATDKLDDT
jgi:hypothetical protein